MNETLLVAAALVAAAGAVVAAGMLARLRRELHEGSRAEGWLALQQQLEALRAQVRDSLEGGRLALDRRLEETQRAVGEVYRGLGQVDRQMQAVGETASELRGLQELLRAPAVRGGVGEYLLAELLAQVLPQSAFALQHRFADGERVDAALCLGGRLVPVDAKFPLDNFRRLREGNDAERREGRRAFRADVRRHVEAVAQRYVRPDEGTFEFAMMYLPAEAVYQELLHQEGDDALDLLHWALARRVVPVSPQCFYAYLQVIVLGLRGLAVEGRSREIVESVAGLRRGLERFAESFDVAGRHLAHAQRQHEEAARRLGRLEAALERLAAPLGPGEEGADPPDPDAVGPTRTSDDQKWNATPTYAEGPPRSSLPNPAKSSSKSSSAQE